MTWVDKEIDFIHQCKMDAVSLQGIWLNYPTQAITTGNALYAAGIYRELLEAEKLRLLRGEIHETPHQRRLSLLKITENKIMERDSDDLFLLLTV